MKHFLWTFLLFGCNSNPDTGSTLTKNSISDSVLNVTSDKRDDKLKNASKLFDNEMPFEIISFTNTINSQTTDTDTIKCNNWRLTKSDIEVILKNSDPISGTEWDLSFLVLTCTKTLVILQGGQYFEVIINAGSFLSINNGDTTVLMGDYKSVDRKYFLEHPNDE